MSATRLQSLAFNSGDYETSTASAWSGNTTSGSTIVVGITFNSDAAGVVDTVTDSQSNVYTKIENGTSGDIDLELWYSPNITGGTTPTLTVTMTTGFHDIAVVAREYGGLTTTPFDQESETTTASSTSHTSANTPTTTQSNELVVGVLAIGTNSTYTAGGGGGNVQYIDGSDEFQSVGMEDKDVTSTGAQSLAFTTSATAAGYFIVATFFETGGATAVKDVIGGGVVPFSR